MAEGTVVTTRKEVYGNPLADDEVAINVSLLVGHDELSHPYYDYYVEARGFTAWKMVDCQRKPH